MPGFRLIAEAPAPPPAGRSWIAAAVAAVVIPLAAIGVYRSVGSPEAIGSAHAIREPRRAARRREPPAFRDRLAAHLAATRATEAWAIHGRVDLALERYAAAAAAFASAIESSPKVAAEPEIWIDYAEAAAWRRDARSRPARAIHREGWRSTPEPPALEMAGSLAAELGDHAGAAHHGRCCSAPRRERSAPAELAPPSPAPSAAMTGGMTRP